jgi:hypothetical protein
VCEHDRSAYKRAAFTFGWHPATSTTNLSWPTPFGLYGIYLNSFLLHLSPPPENSLRENNVKREPPIPGH